MFFVLAAFKLNTNALTQFLPIAVTPIYCDSLSQFQICFISMTV